MFESIRAEFRRKVTDLVAGGEALTDDEFWEHAGDIQLAALNAQSKAKRAARRAATEA